jgi:hypothetical protein
MTALIHNKPLPRRHRRKPFDCKKVHVADPNYWVVMLPGRRTPIVLRHPPEGRGKVIATTTTVSTAWRVCRNWHMTQDRRMARREELLNRYGYPIAAALLSLAIMVQI